MVLNPRTRVPVLFIGGLDTGYYEKVLSYSPIAYWMMAEASGTDSICQVNAAQNGTYTGVTLGQTGIGDDNTCPLFDGTNDFNNIYTATFIAAFSGAAGTVAGWAKVSAAGVWTDGSTNLIVSLRVDVNNRVLIFKDAGNNVLTYYYRAGGTAESIGKASISETGWMHLALTWDKTADQVKAYYNGVQEGATQTGLGTWVGALGATTTVIGAQSTGPANTWSGNLAHWGVWTSALNADSILDLATV